MIEPRSRPVRPRSEPTIVGLLLVAAAASNYRSG
jgi:hypothetical protein